MNKINARDYGIIPGMKASESIEKLINTNTTDTEIFFDAGIYILDRYVDVRNLKNVIITGEEAVFAVSFDAKNPSAAQGAFRFYDCEALEINSVGFTNDKDINCAGEVIATDPDNLSYKVKLYECFSMQGEEKMIAVDSLDADNTPDYVMVHYRADTKYEYIGDNTLKVTLTDDHRDQIKNLKIGHKLAIRHSLNVNPTIRLWGCKDVLIENVRVYSSHSNILNIHPRSENITIRKMVVDVPENSKRLMTTNKDGIHVIGCCGTLTLEDCEFVNMGDDSLNVHSKAGAVSCVENNTIKCVNIVYEDGVPFHKSKMKSSPLSEDWAIVGDRIDIHDPETFVKKGTSRVRSYNNGDLVLEDDIGINPGDILCNAEFYPKTIVRNTNVHNTRARGFLLQTHDVLIEKCNLYGIALSGILFAPDTVVWAEVGPSEDIIVRNNTFEKCCYDHGILSNGVISFQESHDSYRRLGYLPIHKRITIENNIFRDCLNKALNISSAESVVVRYNEIDNCIDTELNDKVSIYAENVNGLQVVLNTLHSGAGLLTENVTGSCTYIEANHINRMKAIEVPRNDEYQELTYKSTDVRDLQLTFYPPIVKTYEKAPLLFMIPGGGWWIENRESMFEFVGKSVDDLRENGFAVVSIDYRVYSEPNIKMNDIITDCFDALRYVSRFSDTFGIDKERISLIAHSAGGHLALMLAYADPNNFKSDYEYNSGFTIKSVAALSPLTNLRKSSNTYGFDCSKAFADCDTDEERMRLSPISYVTSDVPATYLAAGTSDKLVYPCSSESLYKKLTENGVKSKLTLSLGGGHVFEKMHENIEPSISVSEIMHQAAEFILSNT